MPECGNNPHLPCPFCGTPLWDDAVEVTATPNLTVPGYSGPGLTNSLWRCCGVNFCDPGMLPRCATLTISGTQTSVHTASPLTHGCCACSELDGDYELRAVGPSGKGWSGYLCNRCFPSIPITLFVIRSSDGGDPQNVLMLLTFYPNYTEWQAGNVQPIYYVSTPTVEDACIDLHWTVLPFTLNRSTPFGIPNGSIDTDAKCDFPATVTVKLGEPSDSCAPAINPCCPCFNVDGGGIFSDCLSQPNRWNIIFTDIQDGTTDCCPDCTTLDGETYILEPVHDNSRYWDFPNQLFPFNQPAKVSCMQDYGWNLPRGIEDTRLCTNRFFNDIRLEVETISLGPSNYRLQMGLQVHIKDARTEVADSYLEIDGVGLFQNHPVGSGPSPASMCNAGPGTPFVIPNLKFPFPCDGILATATIWADDIIDVQEACTDPLEHRCWLCECAATTQQFTFSHDALPQVGPSPPTNSCPPQVLTLSLPTEGTQEFATIFSCIWYSPGYDPLDPCSAFASLTCDGGALKLTVGVGPSWRDDTVILSADCAEHACDAINESGVLTRVGTPATPSYTFVSI